VRYTLKTPSRPDLGAKTEARIPDRYSSIRMWRQVASIEDRHMHIDSFACSVLNLDRFTHDLGYSIVNGAGTFHLKSGQRNSIPRSDAIIRAGIDMIRTTISALEFTCLITVIRAFLVVIYCKPVHWQALAWR
jgi:hypothetical protein